VKDVKASLKSVENSRALTGNDIQSCGYAQAWRMANKSLQRRDWCTEYIRGIKRQLKSAAQEGTVESAWVPIIPPRRTGARGGDGTHA
jgi:hypothetical protein